MIPAASRRVQPRGVQRPRWGPPLPPECPPVPPEGPPLPPGGPPLPRLVRYRPQEGVSGTTKRDGVRVDTKFTHIRSARLAQGQYLIRTFFIIWRLFHSQQLTQSYQAPYCLNINLDPLVALLRKRELLLCGRVIVEVEYLLPIDFTIAWLHMKQ